MMLDEAAIPVTQEVQGACEILGLDPLYVANEGNLLAIVSPGETGRVLRDEVPSARERSQRPSERVTSEDPRFVLMKTRVGGTRVVDMLSGEQLPRIC